MPSLCPLALFSYTDDGVRAPGREQRRHHRHHTAIGWRAHEATSATRLGTTTSAQAGSSAPGFLGQIGQDWIKILNPSEP